MQPSIYHLRLQDLLAICVLALLFLGVIMVQSASMSVSAHAPWHWSNSATRHVIFAAIALVTFFGVGHLDYARIFRGKWLWNPVLWFLVLATVACVLVLVPHVGLEVNGARRWLPLGITQVQPSELGKWSIVLFLAWWLTARPIDTSRFTGFVATLIPVAAVCLLVVIEDLGTAALIGLCALVICLAGRIKLWHIAIIIPPALAAGLWFLMHKEYRWRRMTAFMDPYATPQAEGYHMIQSLLSFATGGIFGTGLGRGVQKLGYLPEDTTDFIFAVICEELGLFGAMLTIALYLGILFVAWQAIRSKRDNLGQLLAFGIGAMIGLQALINIAVATVSVPPKGMSLPLVSAGGSGLIITSAALGLLYSVCRHQHNEAESPPSDVKSMPTSTEESPLPQVSALPASA
jgi:cell division protein FtsW